MEPPPSPRKIWDITPLLPETLPNPTYETYPPPAKIDRTEPMEPNPLTKPNLWNLTP